MRVEVILPAQEVSGQVVGGGQREGGQGVHPAQPQQLDRCDVGDLRAWSRFLKNLSFYCVHVTIEDRATLVIFIINCYKIFK